MNKFIKLLFVFLLGFMIIPMVHAEALPEEGVMYFMYYPNGEEEVITNYNEAANPTEKLIYSGITDSTGKINLCDWESVGQLRIVQHVPDGYTTKDKEVTVDLSTDTGASFVDYRGITNPSTGRSILILLGVAGVVITTILVSRKNKKSLLVIPIVLGLIAITYVKAETCFCIQVKDGSGKAIANVQVDIYAKPNDVEGAAAIVYDANGGKFFDGKEKIYIRIPYDNCTQEEFVNSLSDDEYSYMIDNIQLVYRDGYMMNGFMYGDSESAPATLPNGLVVKAKWEAVQNGNLVEIDGNGGVINFHGTKLTKAYITQNADRYVLPRLVKLLSNNGLRFTGYDKTSACSRFNENGVAIAAFESYYGGNGNTGIHRILGTYYACWNEKPDGIYVNDELFVGNPSTCFDDSGLDLDDDDEDSFYLYNGGSDLYIGDYTLDDVYFAPLYMYKLYGIFEFSRGSGEAPEGSGIERIDGNVIDPLGRVAGEVKPITKVEIVENGRTILTLTTDDFEYEDGNYYIGDDDKRPVLLEYLAELDTNECFGAH